MGDFIMTGRKINFDDRCSVLTLGPTQKFVLQEKTLLKTFDGILKPKSIYFYWFVSHFGIFHYFINRKIVFRIDLGTIRQTSKNTFIGYSCSKETITLNLIMNLLYLSN